MKKIITILPSVTRLTLPVACALFASADMVVDEDALVDSLYEEEAIVEQEPPTTTTTTTTTPGKKPTSPGVVNRVAATVNGRPITSSELRHRLAPYMRELTALHPTQGQAFSKALVAAKKKVLDELIERELVLGEFESQGYHMPEQQVDEEINNRILNQFAGKRDNLLKYLKQTGQTFSSYRKDIRNELIVAAMRSTRYEQNVPPTPDEVRNEYMRTKRDYRDATKDKVRFDKIFLPMKELDQNPEVSVQANYKEAQRIAQSIAKGTISFADAAKRFSEDSQASAGGVWPETTRGALAPDFAGIVFSAKPGELVGPLFNPSGFTIVKVKKVTEAPAPPLTNPEIRKKVTEAALRRKSEKNYRTWVERLKKNAIIRRFV